MYGKNIYIFSATPELVPLGRRHEPTGFLSVELRLVEGFLAPVTFTIALAKPERLVRGRSHREETEPPGRENRVSAGTAEEICPPIFVSLPLVSCRLLRPARRPDLVEAGCASTTIQRFNYFISSYLYDRCDKP